MAAQLTSGGVRFLGKVAPEWMPKLYADSDIYLNASEVDNQPVSILEAFASGLPVISTPTGDIPSMVRHGETGLIVPPEAPVAMARAIAETLDRPERALQMAEQAHDELAAIHVAGRAGTQWSCGLSRFWVPGSGFRVLGSGFRGSEVRCMNQDAPHEPTLRSADLQVGLSGRDPLRQASSRCGRHAVLRDRRPQPSGSREADRSRHDRRSTRRSGDDPARSGAGVRQPCGGAARFCDEWRRRGSSPESRIFSLLLRRLPAHRDAVLSSADATLQNRFDLLGYRTLWFGDPIDWHLDPVWSRRAPRVHWTQLNPLDPARSGRQQSRVGAESAPVGRRPRAGVCGDRRRALRRKRASRRSNRGSRRTRTASA